MSRPTPRRTSIAVLIAITGALFAAACGDNVINNTKDVTAFTFTAAANPGLSADVTASVSGTTIAAIVPHGTIVTSLKASFTITGRNVVVSDVAQVSGVTANDFTAPVVYQVFAGDNSEQDYTVTVTAAPAAAKDITTFAFLAAHNSTLIADVAATITGTTIAATVPYGTDVTTLDATFTTTGASVTVGGVAQVTGTTKNNFTSPVTYHVTASDGTSRDFVVTVTIATTSAKAITAFSFTHANNSLALAADVTATITNTTITATVPFGTDVTGLIATFSDTGASVTVDSAGQTSGTTINDFTSAVVYHVSASDGTTQDYTVTVVIALNTAKALTGFSFQTTGNGLTTPVVASFSGVNITAVMPYGTDLTSPLIATFATTGASVKVASVIQISGTTANIFMSGVAVTYTVTAADGSTATYQVTVTDALSSAKQLSTFSFASVGNPSRITSTVDGTFSGTGNTTVTVVLPYGTPLTALIASFTTTGATVEIGSVAQTTAVTVNDFSMGPLTYTVVAADGSMQSYTVNVSDALNPAKDITGFSFQTVDNSTADLQVNVTASIDTTAFTIAATVPFGTNVSALVAKFATTGTSVVVGTTPAVTQMSEMTANNFATPVTYVVTAADGTQQSYVVTVTIAANPLKTFGFVAASNTLAGLQVNIRATITASTITATVPFLTDVTHLIASFTTATGATVAATAALVPQTSGSSLDSFIGPLTYVVTSADGSTQTYTATITVAGNPLVSFKFLAVDNTLANLTLDETGVVTSNSVNISVPFDTDPTQLIAAFKTTATVTGVTVNTVAQQTDKTAVDFTAVPTTYVLTSADGSTQSYNVKVNVAPNPIASFSFLHADNTTALQVDETATVGTTTITTIVPFGTDVTNLVAAFTPSATSGTTVVVGTTTQTSDMSGNDFSAGPVTYVVTSADLSVQTYQVTVTVATDPLTAFGYDAIHNGSVGLMTNVTATISAGSISLVLPYGTHLPGPMIAQFTTDATVTSVTVNGAPQTTEASQNLMGAAPVTYVVTSADGSVQSYLVSITTAASPLTGFTFLQSTLGNSALPGDVLMTINGQAITGTVPFGTDVSSLVATFASLASVTSVDIGFPAVAQQSGVTANDFRTTQVYVVTSSDGTSVNYSVQLTVAPGPSITAFSFLAADNPGLAGDVLATISGTSITATAPFGWNPPSAIARFTATDPSVVVGTTAQTSGMTANNFSSSVSYVVGSSPSQTFTVTVTEEPANTSTLFNVFLRAANNPSLGLASDLALFPIGATSFFLPFPPGPGGPPLTHLVLSFSTTGSVVEVLGVEQTSGVTANDFTSPVSYVVFAGDGTTTTYTIGTIP